jgi:hypothetical protein
MLLIFTKGGKMPVFVMNSSAKQYLKGLEDIREYLKPEQKNSSSNLKKK